MNTDRYCYVTFVTKPDYLPGLFALVRSLKRVKSQYPLVVCIPNDNPALHERLKSNRLLQNAVICTRPMIELPDELKTFDHWKETFFKLSVASLVEYDKVVAVDCDMLICKNLDHLFERPSGSAVQDVENIKAPYAESFRFNSGLFVLKPDMELFAKLCRNIGSTVRRRNAAGLMVGDQDVLNDTLCDWGSSKELWLDQKYNVLWPCLPTYEKDKHLMAKDVFVIHFIGWPKPWKYSKKENRRILLDLLLDGKHFKLARFYKLYLRLCR